MKLVSSNSKVALDPLDRLDYMLPAARERCFAAADIPYKAGDSLERYMEAKCALGELRRKARVVQALMEITGAATEEEGLEILKTWIANQAK